jgi:hypothetical protein
LLAVAITLGVLPGCARRTDQSGLTNSQADTLANGLPRALLPKLAPWVQAWRNAIPAFAPDSLRHAGPVQFHYESGWAGTGGRINSARTRALIEVVSPDSARSLDFDAYLDFGRGHDGNLLSEREPDSRAVLADFKADSAWVVEFCGTMCDHDGAYWVDAERFVLTGTTQTGEQMDGPRCPFLDIYDLRSRQRTRWSGSTVGDLQYYRHAQAADSALAARLARAGFGQGADSDASSRGFPGR